MVMEKASIVGYNPVVSADYRKICELGNVISETILARRVPQPDHLAQVLGEEAVNAYLLMHALTHAIEYGKTRGVLESARRDGRAIQIHSFDAAFKPYYRLVDPVLPSGHYLRLRERIGLPNHDLGEESGKILLGALVVNDSIGYLIGEDYGKDADTSTNKNGLLMRAHESEIKRLPDIDDYSVHKLLERKMLGVRVSDERVQRQYKKVLDALKGFRKYVSGEVDYMPYTQKDEILGRVSEMASKLSEKISRGEILSSDEARDVIRSHYGEVMEIIEDIEPGSIDQRLLLPENPEFLVALKQSIYRSFIRNKAGGVVSDLYSAIKASYNNYPVDDSYLAHAMIRLADSTQTAANMDANVVNAASIFGKTRIVSEEFGIRLHEYLRLSGIADQRLQRGVDYLLRNLSARVNDVLGSLRSSVTQDNNWLRDLRIFATIVEEAISLEKRVAETRDLDGWADGVLNPRML
jgi:hypothetical protein